MGEAGQNRRRRLARLSAQPWCVYCGGVNEATTIDHLPPITRFSISVGGLAASNFPPERPAIRALKLQRRSSGLRAESTRTR
jgi:hypothetical protein